jgi:hypothetical protein
LIEFGFQPESIPAEIFSSNAILNFGIEPVRIDLLHHIDGVSFSDAQEHSVRGYYGDEPVIFIGIDELKRNKASTGRLQDSADLEELEERSS